MGGSAEKKPSRGDIVFMAVLLAVGVVAVTAMVCSETGRWFEPATAAAIYRVLWVLLWLPGLAFCIMLLPRRQGVLRMPLVVGFVLQVVALVQDPVRGGTALGGALGCLGLAFPLVFSLVASPRTRTRQKAAYVAVDLGVLLYLYFADPWPFAAFIVAVLWIPYARTIWPSVDRKLEEDERQEAELQKRSRAYRWFCRIPIALLIVVALALVVCIAWALWMNHLLNSRGPFTR